MVFIAVNHNVRLRKKVCEKSRKIAHFGKMAKIHEKIGSQVETLSLVPKECCSRNQKFWLAGIKNREPKQFPLYIIMII